MSNMPIWAQSLRQKYLAGEASVFILYGNIFDHQIVDGKPLTSLRSFLCDDLFADNKRNVFEIDAVGVKVLRGDANLKEIIAQRGESSVPRTMGIFEGRMSSSDSNALIFPYADMLFPSSGTGMLSMDERVMFTYIHRWSLMPEITGKDNVILLLAETLGSINPALLASPKVAAIHIPLPDIDDRRQLVRNVTSGLQDPQIELLAKHTAGLRLVQIASILATPPGSSMTEETRKELIASLLSGQADAKSRADKLASITAGMSADDIRKLINPDFVATKGADPLEESLRVLHARKKEAIEKECSGLVEIVEPKFGFEAVGGLEGVKEELLAIANIMKSGETERAPMGILAVGPMGAGKTFVIKAFLKESGIPGIVLKNFRSKWVGSTESNLETVLATVKAMGPCALIIDESDRSFGGGSEDSDGGTSSRVIARLKEFMSDTGNRGQVLFILMTNRPDKLDVDIKRPGRLDRKIPFFYPETREEKVGVVSALLKRVAPVNNVDLTTVVLDNVGYSAADWEALVMLAAEDARRAEKPLDNSFITMASEEFIPPQDSEMIRLMEYLAVMESSRRSMLPERFRKMDVADIKASIAELKQRIR